MSPSWSDADSSKAQQIWADYQKQHDVSGLSGQSVGIDPHSGGVWFGESAQDIVNQLSQQGALRPLLFLRVGKPYY
jgi:hypothetical protein